MTIEIQFRLGTLVLRNLPHEVAAELPWIVFDHRTREHACPAFHYRETVLDLQRRGLAFQDGARAYERTVFTLCETISPRPYQEDALKAWTAQGGRGVVVLPTGAGKTILAVMAIAARGRPCLVHVPTIDLMHQWYHTLRRFFGGPVGLVGGGYREFHPITVTTYDSALIHVPQQGNRFGMLVFDECHHLPSEQLQFAAVASLAPFRLGLTATPDREDGRHAQLDSLCGPIAYEISIRDLEGRTLAPYDVITLPVDMTPEQREAYDAARATYVAFLRREGIIMNSPQGWQTFLMRASRTAEGRAALEAYRVQKRVAEASEAKEEVIWELLVRHRTERILIFTQDNETAYRLGRRFFLPVITHQTKVKERELMLESFRAGRWPVLVTSKVLNEGVDVPEASVALVVSGSGAVREHVQRLGRILRSKPGKRACLYEIVSAGTGEFYRNQRRRQHVAYQGATALSDAEG